MQIGIIGAGNVGQALGTGWLKAGHEVLFSSSREPKRLEGLVSSLGGKARAGTPAEAARFGEVVVLAVPWPAMEDALRASGPLAGKIVVDCTNPLKPDLSGLEVGHTRSAAEEIARRAAGARVVKAFNTTGAENMRNPRFGPERASMFLCGDDRPAKAVVEGLARDLGFETVDAGPLAAARLLEPLAMLWISLAYAEKQGTDIAFKLLRR